MVNRVSRSDAVRTLERDRGAEGLTELMASDVEVRVRACVMSCFNFTYKRHQSRRAS